MPRSLTSHRQRLTVLGVLWLTIIAVVLVCHEVVLPFVSAALIAYIVAPLVERITRLHVGKRAVPHWVAILVIYAAFFLGVYLFLVALLPQLYRELMRISRDAMAWAHTLTPDRVQELASRGETWLSDHGIPVSLSARALDGVEDGVPPKGFALDLQEVLHGTVARGTALVQENAADIFNVSRHLITGLLAGVFGLFFMLMIAAFFSIDAHSIRVYAQSLLPPEHREEAHELVERIDRALSGVVRGQLTICLVNGTLTFVGLVLFGVKFAFLLSTLAMLLSLVPIFGTILSSVPICLIAASSSLGQGFAMLLWIVGIHALEAYFLNPRIMGKAARIHPVVVAFALIAGEHFFGLVGALLAAPVAAILCACFDFARLKAQAPGLVSSEPVVLGAPATTAVLPPAP